MSQLFEKIPDTLFSPVASANRRLYATLLIDLYPLFFDQIHADVFPSRETVLADIEQRVVSRALALQEEGDYEITETNPAAAIYRRLRDAGWFEEEQEGYRVQVTVPPAVALLWSGLMEIARPEKVFYGGMVLSIHNNLKQALAHPEEQALALRQAALEAKRFHQHLNSMIYGLKGLLESFAALDDHRAVLSGFFEQFVEHFLVQDYKRLTTRNNPFRFRQQILEAVRQLEFDTQCKQSLVAGYMAQSGEADTVAAEDAIDSDIDRLRRTFEQIDSHLDRINKYRAKVEARVADTVRYLDRTQPGMSAHLVRFCEKLAPSLVALNDDDPSLSFLPLINTAPLTMGSLFEPRRVKSPPEPRPLRKHSPDPAVRERQKRMRAYLDRRRIDPKRIVEYLEGQLGDRSRLAGSEMSISCVQDFIAFSHLRHLFHINGSGQWRRHYRIEPMDAMIDNSWLRCPGFVVHREGKA